MAPKKLTSKKRIIAYHFPDETAAEKRTARLDEILAKYESLETELNALKVRVSALEDAAD